MPFQVAQRHKLPDFYEFRHYPIPATKPDAIRTCSEAGGILSLRFDTNEKENYFKAIIFASEIENAQVTYDNLRLMIEVSGNEGNF